ncbi:hypothetical protein EJB05_51363 [Eragrostis curvula]|uniref:UBP-type domain-containing protein n=1 Tax=Eragrostis curvula TaxID=38414 RepID=A0A5J9SVU7_9POAL|nr:hypothetical protein EJB05_51577 [Eragrostis curvula]TVU03110.1 hypothetical protein EJB05_51363 [Eragrostis curvula]
MATAGDPAAYRASPAALSASAPALDSVHFSSGNPRIEEARGVVLLHPDPPAASTSSSDLPPGRKPRVCVLAVPNHMTYADFCRFCGAFVPHTLEMRIVRIDETEDQYSVLIKFDTQKSTDSFYKHFNGKQFSSLEGDVCQVRFVEDVHYTQLIEHAHSSVTSSAEQPTCPNGLTRTLEAFSLQSAIILFTARAYRNGQTLLVRVSQVCRYCQQQPEKSMCSICGTPENLWICVICGHVGCGRYKGGHAIEHWKETQHCYSLELETQKVWDYAGDNYVHRLIQSKTDGKLVEYNCHGGHAADSTCWICCGDAGISEALLNSKVEAIVEEYNDLLTSQLEKQRNYYESLLLEAKEENEREISAAIEKALSAKAQKLQAKLDKCLEEKRFLDEINGNLVKNQEMCQESIRKVLEREKAAIRLKDEKIQKLEEELTDLIAHFECQDAIAQAPESISSDIQGGTILPVASASSSSSGSPVHGTSKRKPK